MHTNDSLKVFFRQRAEVIEKSITERKSIGFQSPAEHAISRMYNQVSVGSGGRFTCGRGALRVVCISIVLSGCCPRCQSTLCRLPDSVSLKDDEEKQNFLD